MKKTLDELDDSLESDKISTQIKIIQASIEMWQRQIFIEDVNNDKGHFPKRKLAEEERKLDIHKINNPEYFI